MTDVQSLLESITFNIRSRTVEDLIQTLVIGITMGGVYALTAIGIVLLYKCSGIVNFAHGSISMMSPYIAITMLTGTFSLLTDDLVTKQVMPYWLAIVGGLAFVIVIGLIVERLVVRPILNRSHLHAVLACLGVLMFLEYTVGWIWTDDDRTFPPVFNEYSFFEIKGVFISYNNMAILAIVITSIICLQLFLTRTKFGLAMRGTAEDMDAAQMMGINYKKVLAVSWAFASALGGLAAVLLAPQLLLYPSFMMGVLIKGFVATIIGGFGSIYGAILGGVVLGVLESLLSVYVSTQFKSIFAFSLVILILSINPTGLIPERKFSREV